MSGPDTKRLKLSQPDLSEGKITFQGTCKHYVKRKKRFCKMTVAKGKEYCGEHDVSTFELIEKGSGRIPCPLDPKHTIYANKLDKHLKICNAKPKDVEPAYITKGMNMGSDTEELLNDLDDKLHETRLSEIDETFLNEAIELVEKFYEKYEIETRINDLFEVHEALDEELSNPEYGAQNLKHLKQTSALLGVMKYYDLLNKNTCFVEFGAGRGQVSYWLAKSCEKYEFGENSVVMLIDRASHRHKQDNRIEDRNIVRRIRADIADLNLSQLDNLEKCKQIVGFGKHLCGVATDFTMRCIVKSNTLSDVVKTLGLVIAFCCHHRCEWQSFVGKKMFIENGVDKQKFKLITRMVSWAICGTGLSREKRKAMEEKLSDVVPCGDVIKSTTLTREKKERIGFKCKRIIDYARIKYLEENGYECHLKCYVNRDITLENVCIIAKLKK